LRERNACSIEPMGLMRVADQHLGVEGKRYERLPHNRAIITPPEVRSGIHCRHQEST
jgi:hypothetical protein